MVKPSKSTNQSHFVDDPVLNLDHKGFLNPDADDYTHTHTHTQLLC